MNRKQRRQAARRTPQKPASAGNALPPQTRRATDQARALHNAGRTAEAIDCLRAALDRGDTHPFLVSFLGALEFFSGLADVGLEHGRQAAAMAPKDPVILSNYGAQLLATGKTSDAIPVLRTVVGLQPQPGEPHLNLSRALSAGERFAEAEKVARAYIAACPDDPRGYGILFETLLRNGRFDAARDACRRLLDRAPANLAAHVGMTELLLASGELAAARDYLDGLMRNRPSLANDLVLARHVELVSLTDGAAAAADECAAILERRPDAAGLAKTLRWMLLLAGRFDEGWQAFSREDDWAQKIGSLPHPPWRGEDLAGRTLLVRGAEGVGDQLLYSQLVSRMRDRVGRLVVECDHRLVPLFARTFPDAEFVGWNTPPQDRLFADDIDLQCLPRDIAGRFVRSIADIPGPAQNLVGSPEGAAAAAALRARHPGKRLVGLSWRSVSGAVGGLKSIPLLHWAEILKVPDVQFVNLQYGATDSEIELVREQLGIDIVAAEGIDRTDDIDHCVGLVGGLDLVITISNVTAHYAGNTGTPVWIMVGKTPLWQWFTEGRDSPWYPSARLYRQKPADTWDPVVREIAADLRAPAG